MKETSLTHLINATENCSVSVVMMKWLTVFMRDFSRLRESVFLLGFPVTVCDVSITELTLVFGAKTDCILDSLRLLLLTTNICSRRAVKSSV